MDLSSVNDLLVQYLDGNTQATDDFLGSIAIAPVVAQAIADLDFKTSARGRLLLSLTSRAYLDRGRLKDFLVILQDLAGILEGVESFGDQELTAELLIYASFWIRINARSIHQESSDVTALAGRLVHLAHRVSDETDRMIEYITAYYDRKPGMGSCSMEVK